MNCFYNEKRDELLFFDQEFTKENCPASYVMYRAVRYFYEHCPNAEQYIAKERLLERNGLGGAWEAYEKEETRLQLENCQVEKYRQLYRWNEINEEIIRENHYALASEEFREAEEVPEKLKRIWQKARADVFSVLRNASRRRASQRLHSVGWGYRRRDAARGL